MLRDDFYHIRRCHVCGATHSLENQKIKQCKVCGKSLPSALFYDEGLFQGLSLETGTLVYGDDPKEISEQLKQGCFKKGEIQSFSPYRPILGLSVLWTKTEKNSVM